MWIPPSRPSATYATGLLRTASILFIVHGITVSLLIAVYATVYAMLGYGIAGLDTSTHGNPPTHNFSNFGHSTALIAIIIALIGLAIGVLYIVGASLMRKQKCWGFLLVLAALAIPVFPFGTAAGFFAGYVLLDDSNKGLFV